MKQVLSANVTVFTIQMLCAVGILFSISTGQARWSLSNSSVLSQSLTSCGRLSQCASKVSYKLQDVSKIELILYFCT